MENIEEMKNVLLSISTQYSKTIKAQNKERFILS